MKSSRALTASAIAILMAACMAGAGPVKVKALKNNVNLRAKPVADAEVVGQVAADDILLSKSMDSAWVEIATPTNVDLWVLGDYVKDGSIQSRQKVNVRSGPGINFAIVGQLAPGDAVTLRGAMQDWLKIAPPDVCSLWVSRSLVAVAADAPAKPEVPKTPPVKVEPPAAPAEAASPAPPTNAPVKTMSVKNAPEKAAAKPPEPKPALASAVSNAPVPAVERLASVTAPPEKTASESAPPPDLDLMPSTGQGKWKQYDGILRPRGVFARTPGRYRLVSYDQDGNGITICYVKGNNDQLSTLVNRPMIVSGREYWVQRQTYPVLIPDRIVLK